MPKYEVVSPDGRRLILEGASAPTEQELNDIFATYKPQDPYSSLDHLKYNLRNAGEGLTFGLGDVVAGITNIPANYAAGNFDNPVKLFKEGRKDFVNEQKAFNEANPEEAFISELGGGLITGGMGAGKTLLAKGAKALAKPTLSAVVKQGAKEGLKSGLKFGGAYGFGSGLTQDADNLSIKDALLGTGTGAVSGGALGAGLGAAIPLGIAGAVGTYNLGKKAVGKVADIFKNKTINTLLGANKGLVEQAVREGKPLLDIADRQLLDVAEGANMLNSKAKQTFADYGQQRIKGQHPKVLNEMEKYFDNRGSKQMLDELNEDILKGSKYLYDRAVYQTDKAGNVLLDRAGKPISKIVPELEKLNKYELDYVGKVYRTKGLEYDVQGLPQNDMRILNYAKQLMDDDIQRLTNQGQNSQARILAEKRAQFIEKIDKANPQYKQARAFYERGKRAEDALNAGKQALAGERKNFVYEYEKLTPEEKDFFIKGVGARLEELSNQQASGGNIAHKMFGEETLRRLRELGIDNMPELEKFARAEMKAASNINTLRGGSPTADRIETIKRFAKRPYKMAKALAIDTVFKPFSANPAEIARAMTDPTFLAKLYARSQKKTIPNNTIVSILKPRTANGGAVGITANKINDILQEQEAK